MTRSSGAAGFSCSAVTVASDRLGDAVAASLAIAALSLCMMVTITMLANKLGAGFPLPV